MAILPDRDQGRCTSILECLYTPIAIADMQAWCQSCRVDFQLCRYNESDPVFNEWVETPPLRAVELLSPNAMLRLTVLDWDIIGSDDLVGGDVLASGHHPQMLRHLRVSSL